VPDRIQVFELSRMRRAVSRVIKKEMLKPSWSGGKIARLAAWWTRGASSFVQAIRQEHHIYLFLFPPPHTPNLPACPLHCASLHSRVCSGKSKYTAAVIAVSLFFVSQVTRYGNRIAVSRCFSRRLHATNPSDVFL
jgi:hypothetical protein